MVPPLATNTLPQYLHFAFSFPFALSMRKYFQQNAFLEEASSKWPSMNIELESTLSSPEIENK